MNILVIIGIVLSLVGVIGICMCITRALKIKRDGGEAENVQAQFQKLVALNMGSLFLSVIGLMCVVLGLFLF